MGDSMETIKIDLATAFTVNSLFWSYLVLQGVDPKSHPIKQELDRVQSYMAKVKEIEDKKKAPRLAKYAAKRFVRNAMFDLKEKKRETGPVDGGGHSSLPTPVGPSEGLINKDKKKTKKRKK